MKQVVMLSTGTRAPNMNYPVNRTDFNIFLNTRTELDFLLKDIDRKPVSFGNRVPVITLIDRDSERVLMERELSIIDAPKGHCRLVVTADDVDGFEIGYISYMLLLRDPSGAETLLHTNRDRQIEGTAQIIPGPLPRAVGTITVAGIELAPIGLQNPNLRSGPYAGTVTNGNKAGTMTIVPYYAGFTGQIVIQGSLDLEPEQDSDRWFDALTVNVSSKTGAGYFNLEGHYNWIRFVVKPVSGTIEKIMLRG